MNKLKFAILLCVSIFFVACDDDEDELSITVENLSGNWQFDKVESANNSATFLDFVREFSAKNIQLNSDMTCNVDGFEGTWMLNANQETFAYTVVEIDGSSTISVESEYEIEDLYIYKLVIANEDDDTDTELIYKK